MKEESLGWLLAAAGLVMLALNTYQIRGLKQGMWKLENEMRHLAVEVDGAGSQVTDAVERGYRDFEAMLKEENSLFRGKSVKLFLEQGKIKVRVDAEPKVTVKGRQVTARLKADGHVFEEPVVGGSAVFEMEPADCFEVSVRAETGEEIQEEEIGTVYPASGLALNAVLRWVQSGEAEEWLAFRVSAAEGGELCFDKGEFEKAELIIVKTGQRVKTEDDGEGWGGGSSSASAYHPPSSGWKAPEVEIPEGEQVPVSLAAETDPEIMDLRADLSAYRERADGGIYDAYCLLTLKGGVQFVSQAAVADFCFAEDGSSQGEGSTYLYPVF